MSETGIARSWGSIVVVTAVLSAVAQFPAPIAHAEDGISTTRVLQELALTATGGASADAAGISDAAANYTGSAKSAASLVDAASSTTDIGLKQTGRGWAAGGRDGVRVAATTAGVASVSAVGLPDIGIGVSGKPKSTMLTDGVVVQSEVARSTDIVTRATQDGLQLVVILAGEGAPQSVDFSMDLPKGARLIQQVDGSISVTAPVSAEVPKSGEVERVRDEAVGILGAGYDGSRALTREQVRRLSRIRPMLTERTTFVTQVGLLARPWAVDANGEVVASHYEVNGHVVRQVVETNGSTAYPVVADPRIRSAWYGVSVDLSKSETKRVSRHGGDCAVLYGAAAGIAAAAGGEPVAAVLGVIAGGCAVYGRVADNARSDKKCLSLKFVFGLGIVAVPWENKCYK